MHGGDSEGVALAQEERSKLGLAEARRVRQYGLEDRLQFSRRAADDLQDIRGRRLLLQRLGKPLFQLDTRFAGRVNSRSRLRSGRTTLAAARWALCAFGRQGHLVGTATGHPFRSAQPRIGPTNPNSTAR